MALDTRFDLTVLTGALVYDTTVDWGNMKLLGDNSAHLHLANTYDGGVQLVSGGSAGEDAVAVRVDGDTNYRLTVDSDGTLHWGSGAAPSDLDVYRSGVSMLATSGDLTVLGGDLWFGPAGGDADTGQGRLWWDGSSDLIGLGFNGAQGGAFNLYTNGISNAATFVVATTGVVTSLDRVGIGGPALSNRALHLHSGLTTSASGGDAEGLLISSTLRAVAGADILSALNISPTFNDNGQAGVVHYSIYSPATSGYMFFGGNIGLGTQAPTPSQGIYAVQNLTVNGTQDGFNIQPIFNNPAIQGRGIFMAPVANGAYTLPNLYTFFAASPGKSGGAAITNVYSFYAQAPVAGVNNWAYYAEATSRSYMGGLVGVGSVDANTPFINFVGATGLGGAGIDIRNVGVATLGIKGDYPAIHLANNNAGSAANSRWFRLSLPGVGPQMSFDAMNDAGTLKHTALVLSADADVVLGSAADGVTMVAAATLGYIYLPTMNAAPTGTPALNSASRCAMVLDSNNNRIWVRFPVGWRSITLT